MMNRDDDFNLVNLPIEAQDPEIKAEDFTLQQADGSIHEQKFQTKPTTFLKDSLRRFRKNKSSVVASYILGTLVLLSIFVPIFDKNDVSKAANSAYSNLQPKLFDSGAGWWDGTKKVKDCPVDAVTLLPDPELYLEGGVTNKVVKGEQYTNNTNKYGKEGYLNIGYYGTSGLTHAYLTSFSNINLSSDNYFKLDLTKTTLTITDFNVVDLDKLKDIEGSRLKADQYALPENFDLGNISLEFCYPGAGEEDEAITLLESKLIYNIGLEGYPDNEPVVLNDIITSQTGETEFSEFYFRFKVERNEEYHEYENVCSLVRSFVITPTCDESYAKKALVEKFFSKESDQYGITGLSFTDAMQFVYRTKTVGSGAYTQLNAGYWSITNAMKINKSVYMGRCVYADFDYDSYAATLGPREWTVGDEEFKHYKDMKWVDYNFPMKKEAGVWKIDTASAKYRPFTITNTKKCPVLSTFDVSDVTVDQQPSGGDPGWSVKVKVLFYKYLDENATSMPKFLFGTDKSGRDMFKYVFEGLRNSLVLGIVTFIVCFSFGLVWGAISGYFGGTVDLVMERITDILSRIPGIVLITLILMKTGESTFGVFALALCLTGWIGTSSLTRTQFYRFRGREYVLASRTLGASDARLIAKHILPNALGTIITSSVLMIPGIIFTEASIAYLGLGFKNLSSLGVILANNQSELTNHPYQLLFPAAVIALLMISFNLFGNGLRDAINPSLKGEEE